MWEQINIVLGKQVRIKAGRAQQPRLIMVDSQLVEMAQKGNQNTVSMAVKRSKDVSAILSLMC